MHKPGVMQMQMVLVVRIVVFDFQNGVGGGGCCRYVLLFSSMA